MKHNIIVKFKPEITKEMQKDMYKDIFDIFNHTKEIEGIHEIRLIPNCIDRENRYHLIIEMDMDKEALPVYDHCEWHVLWKEKYGDLLEKKAIIDYEEPIENPICM